LVVYAEDQATMKQWMDAIDHVSAHSARQCPAIATTSPIAASEQSSPSPTLPRRSLMGEEPASRSFLDSDESENFLLYSGRAMVREFQTAYHRLCTPKQIHVLLWPHRSSAGVELLLKSLRAQRMPDSHVPDPSLRYATLPTLQPPFCFAYLRQDSCSSRPTVRSAQLKSIFDRHPLVSERGSANTTDALHVMWYVIDAADEASVTEQEVNLLRNALPNYLPLIVLHLAACPVDAVDDAGVTTGSPQQRRREQLDGGVTAQDEVRPIVFTEEPETKDKDDDEEQEEEAHHQPLLLPPDLENVFVPIRSCLGVLPVGLHRRSSLIGVGTAMQWSRDAIYPLMEVVHKIVHTISCQTRTVRSRKIIEDFVEDFKSCFTKLGLITILSKLFTRLAACWMFKEYIHEFATQVARHAVEEYSLSDSLSLLIRAPGRDRQLRKLTALAVIWCRVLMQLSDTFFKGIASPLSPLEIVHQLLPQLRDVFSNLTSSAVRMLMLEIEAEGLDPILQPSRLSSFERPRRTLHPS